MGVTKKSRFINSYLVGEETFLSCSKIFLPLFKIYLFKNYVFVHLPFSGGFMTFSLSFLLGRFVAFGLADLAVVNLHVDQTCTFRYAILQTDGLKGGYRDGFNTV